MQPEAQTITTRVFLTISVGSLEITVLSKKFLKEFQLIRFEHWRPFRLCQKQKCNWADEMRLRTEPCRVLWPWALCERFLCPEKISELAVEAVWAQWSILAEEWCDLLLPVYSTNQQVLDPHSRFPSSYFANFSTDSYLVLFFWGMHIFSYQVRQHPNSFSFVLLN